MTFTKARQKTQFGGWPWPGEDMIYSYRIKKKH